MNVDVMECLCNRCFLGPFIDELELGLNPFPSSYDGLHDAGQALDNY